MIQITESIFIIRIKRIILIINTVYIISIM